MSQTIVNLDVREDLRKGQEPFSKIMVAVAQLPPGASLRLVAPFEPAPLFSVLGSQGFDHESRQISSGDWEVLFTRRAGEPAAFSPPTPPTPPTRPTGRGSKCEATNIMDVDARGLEPPQPLVMILEALAFLPAGAELHARTERKPMHLYNQLEARGFAGTTEEQNDGTFITKIRRH